MNNIKKIESVFILKGAFTENEYNAALKKIKNFLKKYEVQEIQEIGKKKLAYEVKEQQYGYFVITDLKILESDIKDIKNYYRKNDDILKCIITEKKEKKDD